MVETHYNIIVACSIEDLLHCLVLSVSDTRSIEIVVSKRRVANRMSTFLDSIEQNLGNTVMHSHIQTIIGTFRTHCVNTT